MAVLVDEARWVWRGHQWAHLVSDQSYEELHEFARALGKRRLGFQGDHYDIHTVDRDRALGAGALAIGSRELVVRLRQAGLRDRHNKPTWQQESEWLPGVEVTHVPRGLADALEASRVDARTAHVVLLGDAKRLALLLDMPADTDITHAARSFATGRRADGSWSVELFIEKSGLSGGRGR
ncbi:MAG: hypothetical protein ACI9C1_001925 [Candidatus Aldehydirespiratoraceae bacterium]|jgi:hypothetical protein